MRIELTDAAWEAAMNACAGSVVAFNQLADKGGIVLRRLMENPAPILTNDELATVARRSFLAMRQTEEVPVVGVTSPYAAFN